MYPGKYSSFAYRSMLKQPDTSNKNVLAQDMGGGCCAERVVLQCWISEDYETCSRVHDTIPPGADLITVRLTPRVWCYCQHNSHLGTFVLRQPEIVVLLFFLFFFLCTALGCRLCVGKPSYSKKCWEKKKVVIAKCFQGTDTWECLKNFWVEKCLWVLC